MIRRYKTAFVSYIVFLTVFPWVLVVATRCTGSLYLGYLLGVPDPANNEEWTTFEEYKKYRAGLVEQEKKKREAANEWDVFDQYEHGTYEVKEQPANEILESDNKILQLEDQILQLENKVSILKNEALRLKNETLQIKNEISKPESEILKSEVETLAPEEETLKSEEEILNFTNKVIKFIEYLIDSWLP